MERLRPHRAAVLDDPGLRSRWFVRMALTGAAVTLFSLLADLTPDRHRTALIALTAAYLPAIAVLAVFGERLPRWVLPGVAVPSVVVGTAAGVVISGDPANPGASFLVPTLLYAFFFFGRRVCLGLLGFSAVLYAAALLAVTGPAEALDRWLFLVAMGALSGAVVSALRDRLLAYAEVDALTGVANRHGFETRLRPVLELGRDEGQVAVLLVDVDDFKALNDREGHERGDTVLRHVADALGRAAGPQAVARLGGDEFVIVLEGFDETEAARVAARAHLALGQSDAAAISIGTAVGPRDGTDAHALLAAADEALYRAKREGKGRTA